MQALRLVNHSLRGSVIIEGRKRKLCKIAKQLVQAENKRTMFRRLTQLEKNQDLSTKFIVMQIEEGDITITEKYELKKAIIDANREKYHQTKATCQYEITVENTFWTFRPRTKNRVSVKRFIKSTSIIVSSNQG